MPPHILIDAAKSEGFSVTVYTVFPSSLYGDWLVSSTQTETTGKGICLGWMDGWMENPTSTNNCYHHGWVFFSFLLYWVGGWVNELVQLVWAGPIHFFVRLTIN